MSELYPRRFLKSLGPLFQEYRKESGFSVRDIARSANISHTIVFDIENRKVVPNPETLKELFDTLGVPIYRDPETLWPLKDTLNAFFEVFYTKQEREMDMYYQSLMKGEKILMHSPLRIELLFAKAINTMVLEKRGASGILELLEGMKDCFTDHQVQSLLVIKGMNAYVNGDYNPAFSHFITAEEQVTSFNLNHLTYYYLAFTADKLFKKELCLYYARIASDKYSDANNFNRKLQLDLLLAKNMIELGNLTIAEGYLKSIRYAVGNTDGEKEDKQWLLNLQGYLHQIRGEYRKSNSVLENSDGNNIGAVNLKAFNAYYQNKHEETREHLRKILRFEGESYRIYRYCAIILLDELGEKKDLTELETAMDYVLDNTFALETKHARTFFTNLIIRYYENRGDYKRALDAAKRAIDQYDSTDRNETD